MAAVSQCIVAIISELHWNARTVSVSESTSTPSGSSWPNPTHSLTASSSLKGVGLNRVPSPWVATSMQIQFAVSVSSSRVRSISTEVVTVDVGGMLVRED